MDNETKNIIKDILEDFEEKLVNSDLDKIFDKNGDVALASRTKLSQRFCRVQKVIDKHFKLLENEKLSVKEMNELIEIFDDFVRKIKRLNINK